MSQTATSSTPGMERAYRVSPHAHAAEADGGDADLVVWAETGVCACARAAAEEAARKCRRVGLIHTTVALRQGERKVDQRSQICGGWPGTHLRVGMAHLRGAKNWSGDERDERTCGWRDEERFWVNFGLFGDTTGVRLGIGRGRGAVQLEGESVSR